MSNNYAGKFVSAETAVKAVQPGDWVDYGFGAGFPELLDRALAARRDELTDVKIRGGLVIRPRIEVVESDPDQKAFSYYSWHIGDYERKLQTRGLCKFMPMMLRSLPEMYRHHIRVDVAFVPVSRMRTAAADWVFPTMHGAPSLRMRAPSSSRSMSASRAYRASMVPTVSTSQRQISSSRASMSRFRSAPTAIRAPLILKLPNVSLRRSRTALSFPWASAAFRLPLPICWHSPTKPTSAATPAPSAMLF